MIKVYHNEDNELGYAFFVFDIKEYKNVYRTFEDSIKLKSHLFRTKEALLVRNVEAFVRLSKANDEVKDELMTTAEQRLTAFVKWSLKNEGKFIEICNYFLRLEHFMITLVNSTLEEDTKHELLMMHRLMSSFVKKEIADYEQEMKEWKEAST